MKGYFVPSAREVNAMITARNAFYEALLKSLQERFPEKSLGILESLIFVQIQMFFQIAREMCQIMANRMAMIFWIFMDEKRKVRMNQFQGS